MDKYELQKQLSNIFLRKHISLFVTLFFYCISLCSFSQNDTINISIPKKPQIIITNDGGTFLGYIETINDREVRIITKDKGKVVIPKYAIKSMEDVKEDNYKSGEYMNKNNFADKYGFASSSLPLTKGKLYFSTIYYATGLLDYAVTNNFSLGLNTTIYGIPLIIKSKASFRIADQLYLGPQVGVGWMWLFPNSYFTYGAIKITQGTINNNFTISNGYFFADFQDMQSRSIIKFYFLNGAFMKRISPMLAFFAEAWWAGYDRELFPGAVVLTGLKTVKKENSSWTFSLITFIFRKQNPSTDTPYIIPVPLIGWSGRL